MSGMLTFRQISQTVPIEATDPLDDDPRKCPRSWIESWSRLAARKYRFTLAVEDFYKQDQSIP